MDNLIEPLTQGLMQAMQIHGLVQHQRDQQEALQRQRFLDARNARIQDQLLANQAEDRSRRNNSEDIAQTQSLIQSGATPLQDGMLSTTMAPPAPQAPLSVALASGGAPPTPNAIGSAGPTEPLPAPPASSMTFGDPLASIRGGVQPTTVTAAADPTRTVKANNGLQYQLPTQEQTQQNALQKARSDAQIKADAKRQEEEIVDPTTGKRLDARAVPILTNKSTVDAENTRSAADRGSREKIAGATDARDRELATQRESAEDKRASARNATTLAAANTRNQPKPLNPLEKAKYDTTLAAGMARAERDFAAGRMKALQTAKRENPDAGEKDIDPDTMNELIGARDRAKQDAHDAYREKLGGFGVDVAPIDFAGQTKQRMAAQTKPAAAAAAPPAAQAAQPPAPVKSQYKVGDVVQKGGKKFKVTGIGQDGKLQAQPL